MKGLKKKKSIRKIRNIRGGGSSSSSGKSKKTHKSIKPTKFANVIPSKRVETGVLNPGKKSKSKSKKSQNSLSDSSHSPEQALEIQEEKKKVAMIDFSKIPSRLHLIKDLVQGKTEPKIVKLTKGDKDQFIEGGSSVNEYIAMLYLLTKHNNLCYPFKKKGFIYDNANRFKDFLSVKKFGQILLMMIKKDLRGTYNVSIGKKVYLNQIINWLNKYNKKPLKVIKHKFTKNQNFYLNNKKLMSKIKIKNEMYELKKECFNLSKKMFN